MYYWYFLFICAAKYTYADFTHRNGPSADLSNTSPGTINRPQLNFRELFCNCVNSMIQFSPRIDVYVGISRVTQTKLDIINAASIPEPVLQRLSEYLFYLYRS